MCKIFTDQTAKTALKLRCTVFCLNFYANTVIGNSKVAVYTKSFMYTWAHTNTMMHAHASGLSHLMPLPASITTHTHSLSHKQTSAADYFHWATDWGTEMNTIYISEQLWMRWGWDWNTGAGSPDGELFTWSCFTDFSNQHSAGS